MKNFEKFKVIPLENKDLNIICGEVCFYKLGKAISDYFDGFRCECGDANPDYSQLQGPKW